MTLGIDTEFANKDRYILKKKERKKYKYKTFKLIYTLKDLGFPSSH